MLRRRGTCNNREEKFPDKKLNRKIMGHYVEKCTFLRNNFDILVMIARKLESVVYSGLPVQVGCYP